MRTWKQGLFLIIFYMVAFCLAMVFITTHADHMAKAKASYTANNANYSNSVNNPNNKDKKQQDITVDQNIREIRYQNLEFSSYNCHIIADAKTRLTFEKLEWNRKILVTKDGRIRVKRGLKKGTYSVKVKITAEENDEYQGQSKIVDIKFKVK